MTKARTKGAAKRAQKALQAACASQATRMPASPVDVATPPQEQLQRPHEVSGGKGTPQRWRFRDTSPIQLAHARGRMTARQCDAADAFEALYRAASVAARPRSCLDFSPRGHAGEVTRRQIAIYDRWRDLSRDLGIQRCAVMVSVCADWVALGDLTARQRQWLLEGLNATADFLGLPTEDA